MRTRSLRGQFTAWLLGGVLLLLLAALAVDGGRRWRDLAAAQDARLLVELQRPIPATPWWRLSTLGGERLQGDATLARHGAPQQLQAGRPALHYGHAGGTLVRAGAVLRPGADGTAVVLQVAEPLAWRVPGWPEIAAGPWGAFAAGVLAMAVLAALAAARAHRWILRSVASPEPPVAAPATPPAELAAPLARMGELLAQQRRWVDEQRRFLADAAHQLRTPMAVLRTQLQTASASDADPRPELADMLHTVDRATGLANQLLGLTRVEQLKRNAQLAPVCVGTALREAVVELSPLLARKRLDFGLDGNDFEAPADAVMLGELLRNLLANAIHHSPRGRRVGVVLRGMPPLREVVIWDQGPGIEDAVRPRLFTPFNAAQGGVGLGLSICQQIAQAMGAQVQLHNRVEHGRIAGVDAVLAWQDAAEVAR